MIEGLLAPMHLMIILAIVIMVFGPRQLPKLGKSLGETIKEFRNIKTAIREGTDEVNDIKRTVENEIRKA